MTKHSDPVLHQKMVLKTDFAQRVYRRGFERASRSLFMLDVVMRFIAKPEEVEAVEKIVDEMIGQWIKDISMERERLKTLSEANGITAELEYTAPMEVAVAISSPRVARLAAMVEQYDALVCELDRLWLAQVLESKHRNQVIYDWQRRTLRLFNRIVDIERRAHRAAKDARERMNPENVGDENDEAAPAEDGKDETAAAPKEPDAGGRGVVVPIG